jgi:hypothetical protein
MSFKEKTRFNYLDCNLYALLMNKTARAERETE